MISCLERKLVLELDGGQHGEQVEYDRRRSAWLEERGYRVYRVWNFEVREDWEAIAEGIWRALQQDPAVPLPPTNDRPA